MLQLSRETIEKELRVEVAVGTSFDAIMGMISNTTLSEFEKEDLKNEIAFETY